MNTIPNFISSVLVGTLLFNVALIGCGPDNGKRRQRIRKDQGVAGKQVTAKPAQPAATADPSKQPTQTGATADPTQQTAATPPADTPQTKQTELAPGSTSPTPPTAETTAVVPPTGEDSSKTAQIGKILADLQLSELTSIQNIPEGQFVLTKIFGKISYEESPFYQALSISDLSCQDTSCSKINITQEKFLSNMPGHGSKIPLTSELTAPFAIKRDSKGLVVFQKDIGLKFIIENGDIGKLDQISGPASGVSTNSGGVLAITLNDRDPKLKIPSDTDGVTYKVGSGPDSGAEIVFAVAQNDGSEIRVFVDLPKKDKTISNFVLIYQKPTQSK